MNLLDRLFKKPQSTDPSKSEKKEFTIYLLDDDAMTREKFKLYYKRAAQNDTFSGKEISFDIRTFESSDDLLASFVNRVPDLLVLDYYLEDSDVFENGDKLRDHLLQKNPGLKIAILSGMEEGKTVLNLIQKGVRDYVVKDDNMYKNLDEVILQMLN